MVAVTRAVTSDAKSVGAFDSEPTEMYSEVFKAIAVVVVTAIRVPKGAGS